MTGDPFGCETGVIFLRDLQGVVWLPLFSWNSINRPECNNPLPTQPLPCTSTESINTDVIHWRHTCYVSSSRNLNMSEVSFLRPPYWGFRNDVSAADFFSSRMSLYLVRPLEFPTHIQLLVRPLPDLSLIQCQSPPIDISSSKEFCVCRDKLTYFLFCSCMWGKLGDGETKPGRYLLS